MGSGMWTGRIDYYKFVGELWLRKTKGLGLRSVVTVNTYVFSTMTYGVAFNAFICVDEPLQNFRFTKRFVH